MFSLERTLQQAKDLTERALVAYQNGVSSPKIYSNCNDEFLSIININSVEYRLVVMEYINGKDFYSLGVLPNNEQLKKIAIEMAKLNSIEYKPTFIYDKWAIVNFIEEYNKNINLVDDEYKDYIHTAFKLFKTCDLQKLKHGFVHGDIIVTNVMKSQDEIYFIDFSVSNYLPRIVDLAVTICDLCLDLDDLESSKDRTKIFLDSYQRNKPLTEYEKECLIIYLVCHQAITILETTREKIINHNDSLENEDFLNKGQKGIEIILNDHKVIQVINKNIQ